MDHSFSVPETGSFGSQQRCGHCKRALVIPSATVVCCSNCRKEFYCSESHQKAHLAKHEKLGCFPAIIYSSPDCGRYWIASRDIVADEVIFTEKAIVLAPNVPCVAPLYPTCLGCCRGTNTSYRCSKCNWPMCNKKCEKVANHAAYECKIFRKNKVPQNCRPQYYFFIQFLRALLLKDKDPREFEELMNLESHVKARKKVKEEVFMLNSFYRFVTEECNLDYDFNTVDRIVGVNRVNCYSADALINGKKRFCTAVFSKLSLINHNCTPNTRTILRETPGVYNLFMELRAAVDIREGEEISQQYLTSTKGTPVRQTRLSEDWFFQCKCIRCKDPSEFNTFFSAIKCVNCDDGYLIPANPLDLETVWECVVITADHNYVKGCDYTRTSETVRGLIDDMDRQVTACSHNHKALTRLLNELTAHSLHPNHSLVINMKFGLLDELVSKLNYSSGRRNSGASTSGVNGDFEDDLLLLAMEYTKSVLAVTRVICPGRNYCVGVVLYFLASCLLEMKARKIPCKFTDIQMQNIVKEAWTILHVEAEGTPCRDMAKYLEDKSILINLESLSF